VERFVLKAVETLRDPDLLEKQIAMQKKAVKRFSLNRILDEWESRVFDD
jgi:hypothetical protein